MGAEGFVAYKNEGWSYTSKIDIDLKKMLSDWK